MKVRLMHPDRDFDPRADPPLQVGVLSRDLAIDMLLDAMAGGDNRVREVSRKALAQGFSNEPATILHRQDVLSDCLRTPETVRRLYGIAVEAASLTRGAYQGFYSRYPGGILHEAIEALRFLSDLLGRLRSVADAEAGRVSSRGLVDLFTMLRTEFSEEYLASIREHLERAEFRGGILMSAGLGAGNEARDLILHPPPSRRKGWWKRFFDGSPPSFTWHLPERDEAGANALRVLRDRGINLVANVLAQSTDHVQGFFESLRVELAFYVGCLNLRDRLTALGAPISLPDLSSAGSRVLHARGLYDPSLALATGRRPVGNDLDADGKSLVVLTGANQGGKTTLLRGTGLAMWMATCGLFVPAETFAAEPCADLFTHFKREEDVTMKSGRFDEGLARMSDIADLVSPCSTVLFNESFASTNEREGAELARQVIRALRERNVRVFFVTHMHELSRGLYEETSDDALFLRAERLPDGTRTFRLVEGAPLPTSHGEDLFLEVFGEVS